MYSFEEAKSNIARLVEDFHCKINLLKSNKYKEANIEDEYIKPMFKYLNWNTTSEGIENKANREFVVQAQGKNGKEPDYLLKLEGKPCFYIEAKHPKYDLFNNTKYIWQAYSYAYSTQSSSARRKVDFSLLTDFEEFRFFDCTFKTEPKNVNNFTVINWKYTDYIDKFQELWDLFERENVRNGSLNKLYLDEKKIKVNRIPPDKAFLSDLDDKDTGWRIILAKDIKKHNPSLSADFITSVVQLVLDRFVFIKVLSDREIEDDFLAKIIAEIDKASLKSDEGNINDSCKVLFEKLNRTYNGSMFEKREELDYVKFSNKTLHSILKALLPENSRYNFKVMPVEILGTIYEQFLGKVVVTTDKRVKIDFKPELKKANGVFYTPQYIVEYIVDNTVGSLLANCKSIDDLMKLKICDPACGSGSFLLGAYDKLINWTIDYYSNKITNGKELTKKERELFYQDHDGNIRLTAKIKRDILKSCIFGVDIDEQAVEVSKMSLSLKALEDTRHDELYYEVNLFNEAVLPNLANNIKCGNSLIGTDYFNQLSYNGEEYDKVKPFDWNKEFPEIFKNGGFDCVIGNPPYVLSREVMLDNEKLYYHNNFKTLWEKPNTYLLFMEIGLRLLNTNGLLSYIIPNSWLTVESCKLIRKLILENKNLLIIDDILYQVFNEATVETTIFVVENKHTETTTKCRKLNTISDFQNQYNEYEIDNWLNDNNTFKIHIPENQQMDKIISKILEKSQRIGDHFDVRTGLQAYEKGKGKPIQSQKDVDNRVYDYTYKFDEASYPYMDGKNCQRYHYDWNNKYLRYGVWLSQPRTLDIFSRDRIIIREITGKLPTCIFASFISGIYLNNKSILNILDYNNNSENLKFLVAQLNSKLLSIFYKYRAVKSSRNVFPKIVIKDLNQFPCIIQTDSKLKNNILILVDNMIQTQKDSRNAKTEYDKSMYQKKINMLDNQINQLVYKLYDLTDEEIKIVEGV